MIIDLASLGRAPKPLDVAFEPDDIDLDDDTRLTDKAVFEGEISRDGAKTHLRGRIKTKVETDCVRCLEPVAKDIDIEFEDIFTDAAEEPNDDEIEIGVNELDESLIADDKIDMAEVVREQLVLAKTEAVYCKEDCKGLCPKCGDSRNLIDCKCEEKTQDPRWAALRNVNRN